MMLIEIMNKGSVPYYGLNNDFTVVSVFGILFSFVSGKYTVCNVCGLRSPSFEFKFLAWSSTAQSVCQRAFSLLAIWCLRHWVRIMHSAEEDNLSPFDSKIACLCQSIENKNNKHTHTYIYIHTYTYTYSYSMLELIMQGMQQKLQKYCLQCKKNTWHVESNYILQPSKYFIIIVNRFGYINNNDTKDRCSIQLCLVSMNLAWRLP